MASVLIGIVTTGIWYGPLAGLSALVRSGSNFTHIYPGKKVKSDPLNGRDVDRVK
jgi:hypothetical protein